MKLAIVTGSGSGLGQSITAAARQGGWTVHELRRPEFTLQRAALEPNEVLASAPAGYERIVLVNNAASLLIAPAARLSASDASSYLLDNVSGPINLMLAFLRRWPNGEIVNVTSGVVRDNVDGWSLYVAAKSAVHRFVESLAHEGHAAMNFDPGVIDTQMQSSIRAQEFAEVSVFRKLHSDGVLRSADDVASDLMSLLAAGQSCR